MKSKRLRLAVAGLLLAAMSPVGMLAPAEARVMLTICERQAWDECEAELGYGRIGDPEFAICYESKREQYCPLPPDPPFPLNPLPPPPPPPYCEVAGIPCP